MFDLDRWQEVFQVLSRNKLRTILTALGVFWGIFMLIIMIGAGNGLESGVRKDMGNRASNSLYVWSQVTTKPYLGMKAGRRFEMDNSDIEALKELVPDAEYICPRNQLGGHGTTDQVSRGKYSSSFEVTGDYPEIRNVEFMDIESGRFLNAKDHLDKRKVAVIGQRVQEFLFEEDEDPIGEYIKISGLYFQVVGVFKSRESGERANRRTQKIYIPFSTFQRAFNYGDMVSWFAITAKPNVKGKDVEDQVLEVLKKRHKIHPEDKRAFGHFNMQEEFETIENVFFGIRSISWVVGFFTLMAGAIGISNIMLVMVKERTKEIGIRRALGARPFQILSQIIIESVFLTITAGYIGLISGIALVELVAMAIRGADVDFFGPPSIEVGLALQALLILGIAGLFAGIIPAQRAISVKPVDALRTE